MVGADSLYVIQKPCTHTYFSVVSRNHDKRLVVGFKSQSCAKTFTKLLSDSEPKHYKNNKPEVHKVHIDKLNLRCCLNGLGLVVFSADGNEEIVPVNSQYDHDLYMYHLENILQWQE